jgi:CheY-like chemotaxis protein
MKRPVSVLVAEDEFLLAMEVEALLSGAGWTVVGPASTLASALKLARASDCDCAVLDVNLRGERVDEVADILAARGIPFVFTTGYGRDHIPALYRGNAAVITKPFQGPQLIQALTELLGEVPD